ncbi:MAG: pyridoxamine 5'-phosphate oxidase family protein [Deltaproteobacteria bacterium]|nr:pyridoxamine 5'-phosphate oxidase family protein [Deltaproteobacteria bacterium]
MAVTLPADVRAALAGPMVPKFLATVGPEGDPNVVPVISIQPWDGETLVFGEYLMHKSRRNLRGNPHVGVLVITETLEAWALRGTFLGFQQSGEWFDRVSRHELLRYNAYTGIRAAGAIRVEACAAKITFSKAAVLAGFAHASVAGQWLRRSAPERGVMPRPVEEKFGRLQAVRAGAFVGADGFPRVWPMLGCLAAGPSRLVVGDLGFPGVADGLQPGARVAVAILTFDPIAYQVKGTYAGTRAGVGVIDLTECYNASPPRVGDRLDHPDSKPAP